MKHKILGCTALLLFAPVASALAGSVYVPLATDHTVQDVRYRTQVWATNTDDSLRQFTSYFIPSESDGTDRPENWGVSTAVAAGSTMLLGSVTDSGETGMLEISGAPQMVISARMVPTIDGVNGLGTAMPVISSANQLAADATAYLQGWIRSGSLRSDFGVVNLGAGAASCSIDVFRSDGTQIKNTAIVSMPPLSHRQFDDALDVLGEAAIAAVRSETTCDQPFYVYLRTYDRTSGDLFFTEPSAKLDESTLQPPGEDPVPGPPAPVNCQNGAHCFEFLSSPFTPTQGNQVKRVAMDVPAGSYSRIHLEMDVTHGGWRNPSSGLHNIVWLAKNVNRDLYAYINFMGPNKNKVMLRHGVGIAHEDKPKILKSLQAEPGKTYHFDYTYDAVGRSIVLIVTEGGHEVARVNGTPNVHHIDVDSNDRFYADMSFKQGLNPNEPATFNWHYANLRVQFIP